MQLYFTDSSKLHVSLHVHDEFTDDSFIVSCTPKMKLQFSFSYNVGVIDEL